MFYAPSVCSFRGCKQRYPSSDCIVPQVTESFRLPILSGSKPKWSQLGDYVFFFSKYSSMIAFAGNGSLGVGELRKSTHVRTILIASCYTHGGWLEIFNTSPKPSGVFVISWKTQGKDNNHNKWMNQCILKGPKYINCKTALMACCLAQSACALALPRGQTKYQWGGTLYWLPFAI